MGEILTDRRERTNIRFGQLKDLLKSAEEILANKACVYVTGSVARGEAGQHSDLDLFIVGVENEKQQRSLSRLDEILLKAQLIEKSREVTFPDFSGDGEYLAYYSRDELLKRLGTRDDDAENTFTARLLLLLESRPLLGQEAYDSVIDNVIAS